MRLITCFSQVNPDSYNYKDDWAVFWKNRMEEILLEKIEIKKSSLREKLSLPNDLNRRSQVRRRSPEASSYETISSDDEKSKVEYQQSKKRRRFMEFPPCYQHDLSQNNFEPQKHEPLITYENETVSFVTVCRLLSALESDLGSLAANVIELLSKAIALEKAEANKSDELMTTENMLFLETVKEKMKGVLVVNVMPSQKVAAIKRCIQNIAKLIHTTPLINTSETRPSSEDEEKKKLAEKIATALIAQGKKDCTAEELDVLVDIFLINNDDTANKTVQKPETQTSNLEALTNQDFKTLLENFAELENDEQSHIIKYLTDLEEQDPQRLEELRNYVTIDPTVIADGNNNNPAEIDDDSDDYNLVEAISSVIANVESHAERD